MLFTTDQKDVVQDKLDQLEVKLGELQAEMRRMHELLQETWFVYNNTT